VQVLNWNFGPRWDAFYLDALRRLRRPIHFEPLKADALAVEVAGSSQLTDSEHHVHIAESLAVEDAEIVAAHEVMHGVLTVEGYPKMAHHTNANASVERELQSLSFQVLSVVVDPRIDSELETLGFNARRRHDAQVATHLGPTALGNPRFAIPTAGSFDRIRLMCALVLLILQSDELTPTRIEAAYRAKAARWFWKEAVALAERIRRIGWDTPECAAAAIRVLRDELGLGGAIFVYDDATKALT
jgi:hypothetical protein